jgi:hypothetical protein
VKQLIDRALRIGMRRGLDWGLLEGSKGWVVIGGLALLGHLAGRAMGRRPETVFFERLEPGDAIQVIHESHS